MSNFKLQTSKPMDNFFGQPVGRSVLYLNDFHNGKHLDELNKFSAVIPKDVMGMASLLANISDATPSHAERAIQSLREWYADETTDSPNQEQDEQ